jgi:hypothetical protein
MFRLLLLIVVALLSVISKTDACPVQNVETEKKCNTCHALTVDEANQLLAPLKVKVKTVKMAQVKGFFEVIAGRDGKQGVIFVDFSKKYIMQGVLARLLNEEVDRPVDSAVK